MPDHLITHKTFTGNRPSLSVLVPQLDAYSTGQLLALYEHRVAVQGFVWGINSFDQWGVELGKVLATKVRARPPACTQPCRVGAAAAGLCRWIPPDLIRAHTLIRFAPGSVCVRVC